MCRSGGRLRRLTLGIYPNLSLADARQHALAVRHTVAQGGDPAVHKQGLRTAPTVTDLATQYVELYAKVHKKRWRDDARLLTKEVLPAWGTRKAYDISRRDVLALLDHLVQRGAPIQANRVLALIRKYFNGAISRELLAHNPCLQVKAPSKEHQRDRVLSDDDIRAIWLACDHFGLLQASYFRLALLTAQRGSEVRSMRWEDVDLETGWWTISAAQAKNGLAHRVPLNPAALVILRALHTRGSMMIWSWRVRWPSGGASRWRPGQPA